MRKTPAAAPSFLHFPRGPYFAPTTVRDDEAASESITKTKDTSPVLFRQLTKQTLFANASLKSALAQGLYDAVAFTRLLSQQRSEEPRSPLMSYPSPSGVDP